MVDKKYLDNVGLQEVKDQMDLIYAPLEHEHDFNDLDNKPNIETDDQDDKLTVTDQNGNIIAEIDRNGVNSVDFLVNGKPITKIFVGTQAEYEAAYSAGEIPVGSVVILTDESVTPEQPDEPDIPVEPTPKLNTPVIRLVEEGSETPDEPTTSAILGEAILGYAILGKEVNE